MKLGYCSRGEFSRGEEMEIVSELEYAHALGFSLFCLSLDQQANRALEGAQITALREKAKGFGMSIIVRCPHYLNTASENPRIISEVGKCIHLANQLSADSLIIHPGTILGELEHDIKTASLYKGKPREVFDVSPKNINTRFVQLLSNLARVVDLARDFDIKVALENNAEPYQFGSTIEEYRRILAGVYGLHASLSTGHAHVNGNSVQEYVAACRHKIINLSLHDNKGDKDEHLPIGQGTIDFAAVLREFKTRRDVSLLIDSNTSRYVEQSLSTLLPILSSL